MTKFWILVDGPVPALEGMSFGASPEGNFARVLGCVPAHIRAACAAAVAGRIISPGLAAGFYRHREATVVVSGERVLTLGECPVALSDILDDVEDGVANLLPLKDNNVFSWCPAEATKWFNGGTLPPEEWGHYTLTLR